MSQLRGSSPEHVRFTSGAAPRANWGTRCDDCQAWRWGKGCSCQSAPSKQGGESVERSVRLGDWFIYTYMYIHIYHIFIHIPQYARQIVCLSTGRAVQLYIRHLSWQVAQLRADLKRTKHECEAENVLIVNWIWWIQPSICSALRMNKGFGCTTDPLKSQVEVR